MLHHPPLLQSGDVAALPAQLQRGGGDNLPVGPAGLPDAAVVSRLRAVRRALAAANLDAVPVREVLGLWGGGLRALPVFV